ncbi:transcriptional regulator [Nocardioides hwasunensis]|uniref:Transcriptional regulator n=1 Tax=Nocardioides hwasunensis TaxID=397258 RepID=A0ABR8MHT0_9ACTN|nr:transcriptional regulator [Nocardioides hwasunensis]MBD3914631.1 transcriptional regulator [Nocardioides hwasunensis]
MPRVRPQSVVDSALACSDRGMADAENAALHGVAIKTIRRWRRLYQRRGLPRGQGHLAPPCPRCDGADLAESSYAELLGWYLGDGHLSLGRRQVFSLHITNDARYVDLNAHLLDLMAAVKPGGKPHTRLVPGAVITTVSWKHWPCLFPQHGSGRKHERAIALVAWQEEIVRSFPSDFLRGLFHSDGCRVANWATREVAGETRRYDYPRWQFVNTSEDILGMCTWALDLVHVPWRRSGSRVVSVSRREAVAALDAMIGPKS